MMERPAQTWCDFGADRATTYAASRLAEAELEAFERHLFECPICVDEVERAIEIRSALAPRRSAAPPQWPWFSALAAAAVLLAVGTGVWLRAPRPQAPNRPAAAADAVTPAPLAGPSLSQSAQIQAPAYRSRTLRGSEDQARSRFRAAMQAYQRAEYRAAIPGLEAAAQLDPEAPDIRFFLGICYLLTEQVDSAVDQFSKTVALGETPYLEAARFYLAKAYLKQGDVEKARLELQRVVGLEGDREEEARELIDQIRRLRP